MSFQLRSTVSAFLAAVALFASMHTCIAQALQASPEHKVLQHDVGKWKAELKMWMGPEGKPDPSATPLTSSGTEENRMLGPYWCISDFDGNVNGMAFKGHAVTGYDAKLEKYVGSWVDSLTPNAMHMLGTYDKDSKTMTYVTKSIGMDGQEVEGKMKVVYTDDDHHTMTMYDMLDGQPVKSMEVVYTRIP